MTEVPPPPLPPQQNNSESNDRLFAIFAHLGIAMTLVMSYLAILIPIIIYNIKKDSPYVRNEAGKVINAIISYFIYSVGFALLTVLLWICGTLFSNWIILIFIILLFISAGLFLFVVFMFIVNSIRNAVRVSNGEPTHYPFALKFINKN